MTTEETLFHSTGSNITGATKSQMFGKPCYKINCKAFICFYNNSMVFKLNEPAHSEALKLSGSQLFDPSGKNRPMKEWVQVTFQHAGRWDNYAILSCEYVIARS